MTGSMRLEAACLLAAEIADDGRFIVIAIGRFRLVEELTQDGADQLPWGLTVMPRDKPDRRVTLWGPEQWTEYRQLVLEELDHARPKSSAKSRKQSRPSVAAATPAVVPASATEDQMLLF